MRRNGARGRMAVGAGCLGAAGLLLGPVVAAHAAASTRSVTVGDTAEGWYAAGPIDICTTPLGCPPDQVQTSPYPADTLHIGVAGGQESARTYVIPDLSSLPGGATVTTAVMTLPVDTNSNDGTQNATQAVVEACLATKPVPDGTDGSQASPPAVDCSQHVAAHYDAKRAALTVDLTRFVAAWLAGHARDGIALLPDASKVAAGSSWQLTVNGRKRAGVPHVSSAIGFTVPAGSTAAGASAPPASSGPSSNGGPAAAPASHQAPAAPPAGPSVPLPDSGVATVATPPAAAPQVAPAQTGSTGSAPVVAQQPVAFSSGGFQYPLAFLMPLALLAGAVFFTRLFTRDASPRRTS